MSPILVRPVREQLEHDRVIRLLQARSRRRYEAAINPGSEQNAPVGNGASALYPDLVLHSLERGHRLAAVVEVETGESVNHLEALAQWAHLARLRAPFHLYVPSSMVDVARHLCEDNHIAVSELWSYHTVVDEFRFVLVHRSRETRPAASSRPKPTPAPKPALKAASAKKPKAPATKSAKAVATRRARPAPPAARRMARPKTKTVKKTKRR